MKTSISFPLLVSLVMVAGVTQAQPEQGKDFSIRIVRPVETEAKYHSLDVENWELMFDHTPDDLNGVLSVTLKIDGRAWKTKTNSTKEPVGVGSETAARSFGLYEFLDVMLSPGTHTLEIESTDRLGNVRTGPSISIKAD